MILTQTTAMLVDAYRELNARKLFWITMFLSLLVAGALACVGVNERGISILWWTIPAALLNTSLVEPAAFYKLIFIGFGFKFWLTWAATIIALISTASIVPDFVAGGSVELSLSKPIGRVRLFLTKYLSGLVFVSLQVSVFSIASFLVIGIRGGEWLWAVFLSVPVVVLFFSYLFSVCALVGLLTRSTIAALFLTIFAWTLIFGVGFAEARVLELRFSAEERVLVAEQDLKDLPSLIDRQKKRVADQSEAPKDETAEQKSRREKSLVTAQASLVGFEQRLERRRTQLSESKDSVALISKWHAWLFASKALLPKTSETMSLLERWLMRAGDLEKLEDAATEADADRREEFAKMSGRDVKMAREQAEISARASRRLESELRSRTLVWVLGTSLLFETVLLLVALTVFSRRDF